MTVNVINNTKNKNFHLDADYETDCISVYSVRDDSFIFIPNFTTATLRAVREELKLDQRTLSNLIIALETQGIGEKLKPVHRTLLRPDKNEEDADLIDWVKSFS